MITISPFSLSTPYSVENRWFSTLRCTKTGGTQLKLSAACFVVQSCLADADFVVFSNYCLIGTRPTGCLFSSVLCSFSVRNFTNFLPNKQPAAACFTYLVQTACIQSIRYHHNTYYLTLQNWTRIFYKDVPQSCMRSKHQAGSLSYAQLLPVL